MVFHGHRLFTKTANEVEGLKEGQTIALVGEADNQIYGVMEIEDILNFHLLKFVKSGLAL